MLARQETVEIHGQAFTLQSVSPLWYFEINDQCGMTGDRKDTARYMDLLFKGVVIAPRETAVNGLRYFSERGDIETPEQLVRRIELFLRPGRQSANSEAPGQA